MTSIAGNQLPELTQPSISIRGLIQRFWKSVTLTWLMVMLEGAVFLVIPLVIGMAIDDLLLQSYSGVKILIALCIVMVTVGTARRFYDTRAYGTIYRKMSKELVHKEKKRNSAISTISARSHLFTEFIEFLEFSIPEISHNLINLIGTLIIIGTLNLKILGVCLGAACLATLIYWISGGRVYLLNKGGNDELERQVHCIETSDKEELDEHFRNLMRWKIRLSDLETMNFTGVWIGLSAALICSVILLGTPGDAAVGTTISVIMYVFGFVESVVAFPLYYQQIVRLQEIAGRLK